MYLSSEEVVQRLVEGTPVLLPEGIHPEVADEAIRHHYPVPEGTKMLMMPKFGNGKPLPKALVSHIPLTSLSQRDPKRIQVLFRFDSVSQ